MEDLQKDNEVISLKQIIISYVRHWRLFVLAGIISLIPAILYLVLYPKTYEVKAMLRIQDEKALNSGGGISLGEAAGLMRSFGLGGNGNGAVNIDDELATLKSNSLLTKVVLALNLDVAYEKRFSFEKLYKDTPIIVAPDSVLRNSLNENIIFNIRVLQSGSVFIKMKETGEEFSFSSLPVHLQLSQGGLDIRYNTSLKINEDIDLTVTVSPASWIAEDLSEDIDFDTYSETANTIELSCRDYKKERGVELLNTLMKEYNNTEMIVKRRDSHKSFAFLDERIIGIMEQLNKVERSIELYKLKNRMTDVEYDVQFYSEALKLYREKLIDLESQKYIIDLLNEYLNDPKNLYKLVPPILASNSSEKGNPLADYNEAIIQWEKMQKTSKGDNPLSEVAKGQIEKLRESVIVSISNTRKSLDAVMSDLRSQEKSVLDKMGNVPTYEREYLDLKRQQEILQGIYLVLLQKKEEVALSVDGGRDKGFIVQEAYAKYLPVAPRKLYAAIFMMLFTIILPVGYLFCKDRLLELIEEYKRTK